MIVVSGEVPAGNILKYTYEFEIPGNLDDGVTRKVIEDLACESIDFRLIGCYKQSCDMIK